MLVSTEYDFLIVYLTHECPGALLLHVVLVVYSLHLGWDVEIGLSEGGATNATASAQTNFASESSSPHSTGAPPKLVASAQGGMLVGGLCDLLVERLSSLRGLFRSLSSDSIMNADVSSEDILSIPNAPTCHGLVLALRYCIEEAEISSLWQFDLGGEMKALTINPEGKEAVSDDNNNRKPAAATKAQFAAMRELWQMRVKRVARLALEGFTLALTVVAEDEKVDESDANDVGNKDQGTVPGAAKGPVNSNAYMFINTNGYMEGDGVGEADGKGSVIQSAIVAAWLLLKESAALLSKLVQMSPPPRHDGELSFVEEDQTTRKQINSTVLLSVEEICTIGGVLLDALGRLRHMGAIAEACSALQNVSECLIRCSMLIMRELLSFVLRERFNCSLRSIEYRHGDRNSQLCRLPSQWLQQSLGKLSGEKQVCDGLF